MCDKHAHKKFSSPLGKSGLDIFVLIPRDPVQSLRKMSVPIPENVRFGSRVQVDKDRATVMFIGQVGDSKGEWLGIEWDDPSRGKHDGTHQGISYFACRYGKHMTSIRVLVLIHSCDTGILPQDHLYVFIPRKYSWVSRS